MQTASDFRQRSEEALGNPQIRRNFRFAMDGLMAKRRAGLSDPREREQLRTQCAGIRVNALSKLPELLEQLEGNCTRNGIQVHWAESVDEANNIVLEIMRQHDATRMIKGKSMVSEEMELNHFLEDHDIECLESDLGEYIVQLAGETPSHIIAPAIHKNRHEIAELFRQKFPDIPFEEDPEKLARSAREILREKFYKADVGLSGVNFAVAETGTLCLVENEGNGRMCTTVPPVHIAVTGIEKVVEQLSDIPPLLNLLVRSATGQHISTYFNMISSPRKPGEKDGPQEVHLVLPDNERSRIYEDDELINTLRCIRCGACMNHCPVYGRIGGHAYGSTIPGPIGSVVEPQKIGLDTLGELPTASTLCGACGEVCPVRIPLPDLLNRLRYEGVRNNNDGKVKGQSEQRKGTEAWIWKSWSWLHVQPMLYRLAMRTATRLRSLMPRKLGPWTDVRRPPRIAARTLHELAREKGFDNA
ncbi:LutB/LldF family L-lactate oxidation iron-sulfur protein [Solemya velesiana gill symbiont]|uniref:Iron-sulfur cluster-binding protein n=1 Tax=Solemya velesiana gill symbiont TaxID=1918948 RepID=A0A1T2KSB7_9GAMM|nr:LutB/LldF family L-lactate oxidation iron-sulfur protein [Solemya velesiana gill symbiont]OOZ35754.1 iron-sulfur cluster-binding protein [Solemya velesiana gill symbiont]